MSVFLDRKEYNGGVFSQLEQCETFIKNHIHLRGEIKGLQRTDIYELPEVALREALINAVIHRDYTNQGRDIKVGVYDDIVNIVSPGGFPNTLTAEGLMEGRSEIRNHIIARVFKELGYIEQWGSGLHRIKTTCLQQGLREPLIRESGDFVDVELYRLEQNGVASDTGIAGGYRIVSDSIGSEQEHQVVSYLQAEQKITAKNVEKLMGVKEARARRILKEMTDKGLIVRKGSARNTFYVLNVSR